MTGGQAFRDGHHGTGPGAITPDGCPVDLYRRLQAGDEPDLIQSAIPTGATILELGSGFDVALLGSYLVNTAGISGMVDACDPVRARRPLRARVVRELAER